MGILLLYCKQFTLAPQNMVIFHRSSPTSEAFFSVQQLLFPTICGKKGRRGQRHPFEQTRFPAQLFYSFFSPNTPEKKLPTAEKKPFTSSNTLLVTSPTLFAVCAAFAIPTSCSCN